MNNTENYQSSVILRGIINPFEYIQPRLTKDNARLSLNQAILAVIQKAEEKQHPEESVSVVETLKEVGEIIKEDKGKIRAIRQFCEDPNITLFMYNLPRKRFPHVAGLHGHRINDLPNGKTQYLFLD